jgi:hypothetical protein
VYLGFFWDICTEAVSRAGYRFKTIGVDAIERKRFLDGEWRGESIDLLCDPTTITIGRLESFVGKAQKLEFTPIIFVANGTYIKSTKPRNEAVGDEKNKCNEIVNEDLFALKPDSFGTEKVEENNWIVFSRQPQSKSKIYFEMWGYVIGATISDEVRTEAKATENTVVCLREFSSHTEAAHALCAGDIDRYYGDSDIITETFSSEIRRASADNQSCKADPKPVRANSSYEPYALIVSGARYPEFPQRITLALYGMFSNDTIEGMFRGHFNAEKSPYLDTLFQINRVP